MREVIEQHFYGPVGVVAGDDVQITAPTRLEDMPDDQLLALRTQRQKTVKRVSRELARPFWAFMAGWVGAAGMLLQGGKALGVIVPLVGGVAVLLFLLRDCQPKRDAKLACEAEIREIDRIMEMRVELETQ